MSMALSVLCKRKLIPVLVRLIKTVPSDALIQPGAVAMVGNTPLIHLHKVSKETGCEILAKAEFCNAGGSIKDRAALFMIHNAEKRGQIKPGGTVVEGTTGNTGIGLAHMCLAMGYNCVIYMPNNQSWEKIKLLQTLGAEVRSVPVVAWTDDNHYSHQARRFAESIENAVWTNQSDNIDNTKAHMETTGPEIWRETNGEVNAVIVSAGTGGTLAGVGTYLKDKNPKVQIAVAVPKGNLNYNWFKNGKREISEGSTIIEGIGPSRVTKNLEQAPVDDAILVKETDAVVMTLRLLHEEGLFVGGSTGLNVSGAVQLARKIGPGHTIVTCLCDTGHKYYNKLFSRRALENMGILEAIPEPYRILLH